MSDRPPWLPTEEERDEVLAPLCETATYGELYDAVERLTARTIAKHLENEICLHPGYCLAVAERFIEQATTGAPQGKGESE